MTQPLDIIWEFRTRNFIVRVEALEEYDLDLSWDEDGSIAAGIDAGGFVAFCARASVSFRGTMIGADYLGGCIYRDYPDFIDRSRGSYFSSMVREAIAAARAYMASAPKLRVAA